MLDNNQNKEGDYQNFQNYQDNQNNQNYQYNQNYQNYQVNQNNQNYQDNKNNQNYQDNQNNQNYQDNQNNQNYPFDQYSSKPQQYPSQDNGNYYSNPQLLNSQTPLTNNNLNNTPQAPDEYQTISDQVAPPISNPEVAMDQQMAQPAGQPDFEPIPLQDPQDSPVQPEAFDNAPINIPPAIQPRRGPSCRSLSIIGFIASLISSIILIIRYVNRKK